MMSLKASGMIPRNRGIFILGNIPESGWKNLEKIESQFFGAMQC